MNIQYEESVNSSSIGKVKNLLMFAALAAATYSFNAKSTSTFEHPQLFNERAVAINYTESTGSNEPFQKDLGLYYKLQSFAKSFLSELVDVPPEFDELFKENFWDILA